MGGSAGAPASRRRAAGSGGWLLGEEEAT